MLSWHDVCLKDSIRTNEEILSGEKQKKNNMTKKRKVGQQTQKPSPVAKLPGL